MKTALEFVILCSNRWLKIEVTAWEKTYFRRAVAYLRVWLSWRCIPAGWSGSSLRSSSSVPVPPQATGSSMATVNQNPTTRLALGRNRDGERRASPGVRGDAPVGAGVGSDAPFFWGGGVEWGVRYSLGVGGRHLLGVGWGVTHLLEVAWGVTHLLGLGSGAFVGGGVESEAPVGGRVGWDGGWRTCWG